MGSSATLLGQVILTSKLLQKILPFKYSIQDNMGRPLLSSAISELYKIKIVKNNSQIKKIEGLRAYMAKRNYPSSSQEESQCMDLATETCHSLLRSF